MSKWEDISNPINDACHLFIIYLVLTQVDLYA